MSKHEENELGKDYPNIPMPASIQELAKQMESIPESVRLSVFRTKFVLITEMQALLKKRNDSPATITVEDTKRMTEINVEIAQAIRQVLTEIN